MMRPSRITNMKLNAIRRDIVYEGIMADLVLMGVVSRETVEKYTGLALSDTLKSPAGDNPLKTEPVKAKAEPAPKTEEPKAKPVAKPVSKPVTLDHE